jgi:hypothetical protein
MQTGLKSDNFCGYNQAAAPFFWIFQPRQYENTYATGEIGVFAAGGSAGSYVRPEVVDVSSFLLGLDNILSKCTPPAPSLDSLNNPMNNAPKAQLNKSSSSGDQSSSGGQAVYNLEPSSKSGSSAPCKEEPDLRAPKSIEADRLLEIRAAPRRQEARSC